MREHSGVGLFEREAILHLAFREDDGSTVKQIDNMGAFDALKQKVRCRYEYVMYVWMYVCMYVCTYILSMHWHVSMYVYVSILTRSLASCHPI